MRAVVSVLWSMTIDCYLWGLDRNSGRVGRGFTKMYQSLSVVMEMLKVL